MLNSKKKQLNKHLPVLLVFRRLASNSLFKFIALLDESIVIVDGVAVAADVVATVPAAPALFVRTLLRVEITCFSSLPMAWDVELEMGPLLEQLVFTGEDDVELLEAVVFVPLGVNSEIVFF